MAFELAPDLVLAKTDKGHAELAHRVHGLSHELRSALIQVDGRRTVAKLLVTWSQWPALAAALATLAEEGFVAPIGPATLAVNLSAPASPKAELVALARSILRENAAAVVGRLERSADDPAALRSAVDAGYKLAVLTIDEAQADAFVTAARAILDRSS
jgi:hypothetical protein